MYYTTLAHYAADNNDADRLLGTEAYALGEGLNKKSSTLTTRGPFGIPIITTVDEDTKDRARRIMNVASRVKSYVCSSY